MTGPYNRFLHSLSTRGWRNWILPLAVYGLVALFITWPLASQLTTHIAGAGYGDSLEYIRLGWWGKYALQHGLNPFYQSMMGYPQGFFSSVQWMQPLIYWPISIMAFAVGPAAAFNLWILLEVILSGLTAYWLCRDVILYEIGSGDLIAPLIGGLIFMAYPAVQGHLSVGHVNPLSNYALPVVVLCLYRILTGRNRRRYALVGALALWILALGNFTFPVFALLPILLFGGVYILSRRGWRQQAWNWPVLGNLMLMFGIGLLLILPFYIPTILEALSPNQPAYLQEGGWITYSTDPLSFVALSPFAAWTQAIVPAYSKTVLGTNSAEGTAYIGIIAILLTLLAIWKYRGKTGLWLAIAFGCMIFSLGPVLKWNDQPLAYHLGDFTTNIVLPWGLFQNLPLINITRTAGRFNITTGLAVGILAAFGLSFLMTRIRIKWRRIMVGGVLITLILLEYQLFFPFLTVSADIPGQSVFESLAGRTDIRAVFDVPMDDPLAQKMAMYEQLFHQKPIIAGYVSRRTSVDPAKLAVLSSAALGQNNWLQDNVASQINVARLTLKNNGVDVVVYHWDLLDKKTVLAYAQNTFGSPLYDDQDMAIFEVPQSLVEDTGGQTYLESLPAYSTDHWWRDQLTNFEWLQGRSSIYVYLPKPVDQEWTLSVVPLLHSRKLQLSIDGQFVRSWSVNNPTVQANTVGPTNQISFWAKLDAGFHTFEFIDPDDCTPVPVAPACLLNDVRDQYSLQDCALPDTVHNLCVSTAMQKMASSDAGDMALQDHPVQLSSGLLLAGFRLPKQASLNSSLVVDTTWQATQKLPGDYHVFAHVLDQNGKLIAQYDTVPGGGTYPTAQWAAQQVWSETLTIPIPADAAPGTYQVYTGWYRYPDLTRLSVNASTPHAADGLVYLGDIEIK